MGGKPQQPPEMWQQRRTACSRINLPHTTKRRTPVSLPGLDRCSFFTRKGLIWEPSQDPISFSTRELHAQNCTSSGRPALQQRYSSPSHAPGRGEIRGARAVRLKGTTRRLALVSGKALRRVYRGGSPTRSPPLAPNPSRTARPFKSTRWGFCCSPRAWGKLFFPLPGTRPRG